MTLLKGGEEIVPGISVKTFRGHTAHMQAIIVRASQSPYPFDKLRAGPVAENATRMGHPQDSPQGPTACYISDLIPTTAHIDLTWGMGFDLYPLDTIASKKEYYAQAIPEKWLTVFTHDPKVPWAYVEKDDAGKMVARGV